jgi:hypothetical protein
VVEKGCIVKCPSQLRGVWEFATANSSRAHLSGRPPEVLKPPGRDQKRGPVENVSVSRSSLESKTHDFAFGDLVGGEDDDVGEGMGGGGEGEVRIRKEGTEGMGRSVLRRKRWGIDGNTTREGTRDYGGWGK